MIKYLFFLLLILTSCCRKFYLSDPDSYSFKQEDLALGIAPIDSLYFEYQVLSGSAINFESETVSCVLKNESSKPFYFQSWSCCEWELNFNYDTAKFQVFPSKMCETSHMIIKKIPPHSAFYFSSYFQRKDSTSELKDLSYFVYPVTPDFDTHDLNNVKKLEKLVIKNRTE